eukprot:4610451-Karenia_brevis.AAC.1
MLELEEQESIYPSGVHGPSDPPGSHAGFRTSRESELDEPVSVRLSISDLAIFAQDEPEVSGTRSTGLRTLCSSGRRSGLRTLPSPGTDHFIQF